jgi:hypothetical protein
MWLGKQADLGVPVTRRGDLFLARRSTHCPPQQVRLAVESRLVLTGQKLAAGGQPIGHRGQFPASSGFSALCGHSLHFCISAFLHFCIPAFLHSCIPAFLHSCIP